MTETEWRDNDDPRVREAFGYALRAHVNYQDGAESEAPTLIFADYDYEVGDGSCGLHEDGKRANEPAIVYVRADSYLAQRAEGERLRQVQASLMEIITGAYVCLRDPAPPEETKQHVLKRAWEEMAKRTQDA